MNKQQPTCIPCGIQSFRRNTYFNGKLLVERDFEAEQAYVVGKHRLHNSLLHGAGTVCGLKVLAHPNPECRDKYIYITPGAAVDCCGRDILVTEQTLIPVLDLIEQDEIDVDELGSKDLFVSLCYKETLEEKIPVILPDCDCADANEAYNRIAEGFEVHLFSQDAGELEGARPPLRAKLDWQHTLTLPYQSPRALAADEGYQQLYVAAQALPDPTEESEDDAELSARLYAFRTDNHDLITAVEGGTEPTDLAVSLLGDRIFLATTVVTPPEGEGDPVSTPVVAFFKEADIRSEMDFAKTIPLEGPARLTVSPHTGALFVLVLDDGEGHAILRSWTNESIDTAWLDSDDSTPAPDPSNTLTFPAAFTDLPGAAMLNVTLNGRYLFIADAAGETVRVVDVASFADITPTLTSEGTPAAVFSSRDSEYLYGLWHMQVEEAGEGGPETVDYAKLTRYHIDDTTETFQLVPDGSGGEWPALPLDLAVSPDERWAYVLEAQAGQGRVQTVAIDEITSPAAADPNKLLGTRENIAGQARYQRLAILGARLYVASDDEATDTQPERGLVAVLDVQEAACDTLFTKALEGCPSCATEKANGGNCVILAHIPAYRLGAKIQDAGQAAEDENEIDNLMHRHLLPSTQNITEVIRCMLEQGIAEGIPGPRGPAGEQGLPGEPGERGPGITAAVATTLEPGSDATAVLLPIPGDPEGDRVLRLGIPAGADGTNGEDGGRGPGIVDVDVTTLPPGSDATAELVPIAGDPEGDQTLELGIPRGAQGDPGPIDDPNVTRIIHLSWQHDDLFSNSGDLFDFMVDPLAYDDPQERTEHLGLVIEFEHLVNMDTIFRDLDPAKPGSRMVSHVFELLVRMYNEDMGTANQLVLTKASYQPVEVTDRDAQGIIRRVQPKIGEKLVPAVRLFFLRDFSPGLFDSSKLMLHIIFRSDFALAEGNGTEVDGHAVDGNFIGGKLPTGNGRAGNTFESWLSLGQRD
ncbi:MAG: hypothetical protein ACK2UQ_17630 [Anaerolineae bacterium]